LGLKSRGPLSGSLFVGPNCFVLFGKKNLPVLGLSIPEMFAPVCYLSRGKHHKGEKNGVHNHGLVERGYADKPK
jgi:hypothetical protein